MPNGRAFRPLARFSLLQYLEMSYRKVVARVSIASANPTVFAYARGASVASTLVASVGLIQDQERINDPYR